MKKHCFLAVLTAAFSLTLNGCASTNETRETVTVKVTATLVPVTTAPDYVCARCKAHLSTPHCDKCSGVTVVTPTVVEKKKKHKKEKVIYRDPPQPFSENYSESWSKSYSRSGWK